MFNETPRFGSQPPVATDKDHMSVLIAVDTSGSVQGDAIRNINANLNLNLNSFKMAICEGVARAMKCLCDRWANVDVTFDAALSQGFVRHDYFGRTDAELSGSHLRDEPCLLPLGDGSLCYYERKSLVATSASRLGRIVDGGLSRTRGAEFVMPALWEGRSELGTAIRHGAGKSAELMARGGAYTLHPNYDLSVFGLEVVS